MHKGADLFYKCRFQTNPKDSLEDPLWTLVMQVRAWMCGKHRSLTRDMRDWTSQVKYGGELRNPDASVRIKSRLYRHDNPEGLMWACQIEEFMDGDDDDVMHAGFAGQIWTTESGYRESSDRMGDVSIMLSYFNEPYYIGRTKVPPMPNVPRIVRMITEQKDLGCNVSGMPIEKMVLGVGGTSYNDSAIMFWSRVNDPSREYPIVYVGKDSLGQYAVDPQKLNGFIFPNALVCHPLDDVSAERVQAAKPINVRFVEDGINVFFPPKKDQARIRQYGFSADRLDAMRRYEWDHGAERKWWGDNTPDPTLLMLRRALAEDVRFSESGELITIDDVTLARQKDGFDNKVKAVQMKLDEAQNAARDYQERLERMRADRDARRAKMVAETMERMRAEQNRQQAGDGDSALRKKLDFAKERISELEQANAVLEKDNDEAYAMAVEADDNRNEVLKELDQAKADLFDATQQLKAYQYGGYGSSDDTDAVMSLMRFELPEILSTNSRQINGDIALKLADMFEKVFPSRVHILEEACKDCITKPELVWQGLLCMCTSVYDIYSQGQGSGSPEVRLKQDQRVPSRSELALSEGSNTNRNAKLTRLREVPFDGRILDITPHLKAGHGKDSEDTLRIYYCWDSVTGKLIIGHIGTHLLNDTGLTTKF